MRGLKHDLAPKGSKNKISESKSSNYLDLEFVGSKYIKNRKSVNGGVALVFYLVQIPP